MAKERDERLYLSDIISAIDRVLSYTGDGREAFFADTKTQDAVVRNIEVIGEAVRLVSEATRAAHPEVPWKAIAGTRDRVIHGYFLVDLDILWAIVEKDLTGLRQQITALLDKACDQSRREAAISGASRRVAKSNQCESSSAERASTQRTEARRVPYFLTVHYSPFRFRSGVVGD